MIYFMYYKYCLLSKIKISRFYKILITISYLLAINIIILISVYLWIQDRIL